MVAQSSARVPSKKKSRHAATIGGKLAALAGATGAVTAGIEAQAAVVYTPTEGVAAAVGIPGFVFVSSTNVTLGTLRPPASYGDTNWDVDGDLTTDFQLTLQNLGSGSYLASLKGVGPGRALARDASFDGVLLNISTGNPVDSGLTPGGFAFITSNGVNTQPLFTTGSSGQFGFKFTSGTNTYYGWGSLVIEPGAVGVANHFTITEAYYNSTPGAAINVGEVPVASVPEPSSIALMAIGSAGVLAWRARRRQQA